jgi:hypothetical protein
MQKCQVCEKENPDGVEYCEDCGASLVAPVAAPSGAPPSASDEPPGGAPLDPEQAAPPAPADAAQMGAPPALTGAPPAAAPPSGNGARPRLAVKRFGALTGEEIPLMSDRLLVGRFDSETGPVDIDLSAAAESEHISRRHGELYREPDGRWFVRDLGSTNGVFVKGTADPAFGPLLTAPRELASGDEVAFGNARFVFRTD